MHLAKLVTPHWLTQIIVRADWLVDGANIFIMFAPGGITIKKILYKRRGGRVLVQPKQLCLTPSFGAVENGGWGR